MKAISSLVNVDLIEKNKNHQGVFQQNHNLINLEIRSSIIE